MLVFKFSEEDEQFSSGQCRHQSNSENEHLSASLSSFWFNFHTTLSLFHSRTRAIRTKTRTHWRLPHLAWICDTAVSSMEMGNDHSSTLMQNSPEHDMPTVRTRGVMHCTVYLNFQFQFQKIHFFKETLLENTKTNKNLTYITLASKVVNCRSQTSNWKFHKIH